MNVTALRTITLSDRRVHVGSSVGEVSPEELRRLRQLRLVRVEFERGDETEVVALRPVRLDRTYGAGEALPVDGQEAARLIRLGVAERRLVDAAARLDDLDYGEDAGANQPVVPSPEDAEDLTDQPARPAARTPPHRRQRGR